MLKACSSITLIRIVGFSLAWILLIQYGVQEIAYFKPFETAVVEGSLYGTCAPIEHL